MKEVLSIGGGYRQTVFFTYFNSRGELITATQDVPTWLGLFWEPDFGLGTIVYRGTGKPLPRDVQDSLGLPGTGSAAPNAGDPTWETSPTPQFGTPGAGVTPSGATPTPPGVELSPLPAGGTAPVKPSPIQPNKPQDPNTPQDPNAPRKPEDGPNFPPDGSAPPPRKPIDQMNYIEVLWDTVIRVPGILSDDLKKAFKELLSNPYVQGFLALLLGLLVVGGPIVASIMAALDAVIVGAGVADLIKGVVNVFRAKNESNEALLDEAAHDFAHAAENLGPAMVEKLGSLLKGFEVAKGRLATIPGVGKYIQAFDTLGSGFWQALQQGGVARVGQFADRIARLSDEGRAALRTFKQNPGVLDKVIAEGPGAISDLGEVLAKYGTESETLTNVLSKQGMTVTKLKDLLKIEGMTPKSLQALYEEEAMTTGEIRQIFESTCFVSGTKVLTPVGEQNIESIQEGEVVIAYDPKTEVAKECRVLQTFNRKASNILEIQVKEEIVACTYEHPFWVPGTGWKAAEELRVGTPLLTESGQVVLIEAIRSKEETLDVYNLEVEKLHTYFVSALGILVHNTCSGGGLVPTGGKVGDFSDISGKTVQEILDRIPVDATKRKFVAVEGGSQKGVEFKWVDQNGVTNRVRIHDVDPTAPTGSNAASGWIVRYQVGGKYYDPTTGTLRARNVHKPTSSNYDPEAANNTHIPIQTPDQATIDLMN